MVYNGLDPNVSLPADDFSMSDGNCSLVIPLENSTFFEFTETTPGAQTCSYPATGWGADPVPDWSNVALANGGDCARIVDLNGCEVFSLCYGSCNQNTMIYFAGNGADDVWSFGGGDPTVQANWTQGCAGDFGTCGANDQTPGAPNNAANQAYISQFNNGCSAIPPLVSSVSATSVCGCTNSATVSASGSIPGYTYEWYDDAYLPIGQTTATATNLCGGTYHVITTSSIGCEDTLQVVIASSSGGFAGNDISFDACETSLPINLFDSIPGAPDNGGFWTGPSVLSNGDAGTFDVSNSSGTYHYVISGTGGCPNDSAEVIVNIDQIVDAGIDDDTTICSSAQPIDLFNVLGGSPNTGGVWSPALSSSSVFDPQFHVFQSYVYTVFGNSCPNASAIVTVNQATSPSVSGALVTDILCFGNADGEIDLTIAPAGASIQWDLTNGANPQTEDVSGLEAGFQVYQLTSPDGCVLEDSIEILEPLQMAVNYLINAESCLGACDGSVDPSVTNGVAPYQYSIDGVNFQSTGFTAVCGGNYTITVMDNNGCTEINNIIVPSFPGSNTPTVSGDTEHCENDAVHTLTADIPNGTWSGIGVDPQTGNFSPTTAGVGFHMVIYETSGVCASSDTIYINVYESPSGSIGVNQSEGCAPLNVELSAILDSNYDCFWDFDNGNTSNSCGFQNVIYENGCYDPVLTVTSSEGCETDIFLSTDICAYNPPSPLFELNQEVFSEFNSEFLATPFDQSQNSYNWYVNDQLSASSVQLDSLLTDQSIGSNMVCLEIADVLGCVDSSCLEFVFQENLVVYVPNTFTPNNDGANDLFFPVFDGVEPIDFSMDIFNRWGELIYSFEDHLSTWDGNFQGVPVQQDVYVWKLRFLDPNSRELNVFLGHVSIIK